MQNKVRVLVAAVVIVALLAGGIIGAEWQKEQPVDVSLLTYSGTDIVDERVISLTTMGTESVATGSQFVREYNVTSYSIKKHEN